MSFAPERSSWSDSDYPPIHGDISSADVSRVNIFNMNEGMSPGGGGPQPVGALPGQGQSTSGNRLSAVFSGLDFISRVFYSLFSCVFCDLSNSQVWCTRIVFPVFIAHY